MTYFAINEYDLAIVDFTETLRGNPKHARAYASRGDAYYMKGDYAGARADYEQALRLAPNDPLLADYRESLEELKNEGW
jgi:Flp pilus assembly protein TadD